MVVRMIAKDPNIVRIKRVAGLSFISVDMGDERGSVIRATKGDQRVIQHMPGRQILLNLAEIFTKYREKLSVL